MKTATIGARIPDDLKSSLEQMSALSGQSISSIAQAAISEYVEWRMPQLLDLKEALSAADRGEFATDDEVNSFFQKHAN